MSTKDRISKENKELIDEFINDFRGPNDISEKTIELDRYCLEKFADYIGKKTFDDTDIKDVKNFFTKNKTSSAYNLYGSKLMLFYRWIENLDDNEKSKRMKWFKNKPIKKLDSKKVKDEMITKREYKLLLNSCGRDRFGMWHALFETFWLSGARLSEVVNMKIKHVELKDGNCIIYVPESKTNTREIPLSQYPYKLERWLYNHPFKDNKNGPLWISNATNSFGHKLHKSSVNLKFWTIRKKIDIKDTLSIHNFRKTRFTIMSNERSKDGGLIYSDKQLALYFGWSISNVSRMREHYDLTSFDELKKTVFNNNEEEIQDINIIKRKYKDAKENNKKEIEELKQQQEEKIRRLEKKIEEMNKTINHYWKNQTFEIGHD